MIISLRFIAPGLAATLLAGSALAQAGGEGAPEFLTEAPNTFGVSKAKGAAVIGQDHTRLGEVADLLIDREGRVQAVVIGVGGVLGFGERHVAVPYGQVLWNTGDVTRASDLGASTAPTKETGPDSTPPKVLDRMPGAQISNEVLRSTADQSSGAVNPATGPVAAPEQGGRATALLVPAGGSIRHAEIRATEAEIRGAPEFKLR
ncbi:PRC-barrel domain-containing protein [Enterovirga aerilata]|uniref:PRC-barrel domain containing protein n=1 Tax=Enterovirga aerilata TaxID=2730920 RepID=A0A849I6A4_9HYPH|nr:PRC-barrel domain-containing protein [Enterovirga sp. DB1703]NNM71939.1 PRC-barrel domain containing protein [Enterovirga sp. DB1703]